AGLGNRHAPDPARIESLDELAASVYGDVLPHEDDALVALQLLDLRLHERLEITHPGLRARIRVLDCSGHDRRLLTGTRPASRWASLPDDRWDGCTGTRTSWPDRARDSPPRNGSPERPRRSPPPRWRAT